MRLALIVEYISVVMFLLEDIYVTCGAQHVFCKPIPIRLGGTSRTTNKLLLYDYPMKSIMSEYTVLRYVTGHLQVI